METALTATKSETLYFASEKSNLFALIHWGCIALVVGSSAVAAYGYFTEENHIALLLVAGFCFLCSIFLGWAWFSTSYQIEGDKIHWRSGVLHGAIDIHSIKHITKNDTLMSGLRPALAQKGLIIQYADWKEIYFSPVNKDEFVEILQQINPQIKVNEIKIDFNKY